jgi:uncharacterized membrane protein
MASITAGAMTTDVVAGTRAGRVRGPRRGLVRLAISTAAAVSVGWLLSLCDVPGLGHVAGWDVGALMFGGLGWARIMTKDAEATRRRAAAEDPGRTLVWVLVLAACAYSLFAAVRVLGKSGHPATRAGDLLVALCLLAVAAAWALTHTSYALRYAHLYYRDDEEGVGGLDFPCEAAPAYFDFAYFSFTVGMCFQVSDVVVSSPQIRRTVLGHAVLSFIYNTTIMALALNLVFGLFN